MPNEERHVRQAPQNTPVHERVAIPSPLTLSNYTSGIPHHLFDELRRSGPVSFHEDPVDYYAVVGFKESRQVLSDPELYSSQLGGVTLEDPSTELAPILRSMLPGLDPPEHMKFRMHLFPPLKPGAVAAFHGALEQDCRSLLQQACETGVLDFVAQIASCVPTLAFARLMGITPAQAKPLSDWAEAVMSDGAGASAATMNLLFAYIDDLVEERRGTSLPGYMTLLANFEVDGPLTRLARNAMIMQIIVGGLETTRNLIAGLIPELVGHQHLHEQIADEPSLCRKLVDEALRFICPVNYLRRTTTRATELGGVEIAAGKRVVAILSAANRDPAYFDHPHEFQPRRAFTHNHLAFGIGEHFCMGKALAILELETFWRAYFDVVGNLELVAEPVRFQSTHQNAIASLTVRMRAR